MLRPCRYSLPGQEITAGIGVLLAATAVAYLQFQNMEALHVFTERVANESRAIDPGTLGCAICRLE